MTPPRGNTPSAANALETGASVYLRYPTQRDREQYLAVRRASRKHLEPWEPRPAPGFDAWGDDQFDWMLKCRRKTDQVRLFLFAREGDQFLGQISLGGIFRGPLLCAFLGYWIGVEFTGRGYTTEAIGLMLRHAFGPVGLHRVEANIQPQNEPSKAVVRKNGFRLEGYSPRYLRIDGRWADHERWAITIEDWESRRAAGPPLRLSRNRPARSRPST
ncbi:MAG: GNAT family N-acetyltransferase [Phycisphaerales bacterium]|nr:GNAT family N-acetyltransferase [Phycisphaerales bacterium]